MNAFAPLKQTFFKAMEAFPKPVKDDICKRCYPNCDEKECPLQVQRGADFEQLQEYGVVYVNPDGTLQPPRVEKTGEEMKSISWERNVTNQ